MSTVVPGSVECSLPVTQPYDRDHLANERTFLAWSKTGLMFIGAGVGLNQFQGVFEKQDVLPASLGFFSVGAFFLLYSTRRYFAVMRDLERGQFRPNKRGVIGVVFLSGFAVSFALGVLFNVIHIN